MICPKCSKPIPEASDALYGCKCPTSKLIKLYHPERDIVLTVGQNYPDKDNPTVRDCDWHILDITDKDVAASSIAEGFETFPLSKIEWYLAI